MLHICVRIVYLSRHCMISGPYCMTASYVYLLLTKSFQNSAWQRSQGVNKSVKQNLQFNATSNRTAYRITTNR